MQCLLRLNQSMRARHPLRSTYYPNSQLLPASCALQKRDRVVALIQLLGECQSTPERQGQVPRTCARNSAASARATSLSSCVASSLFCESLRVLRTSLRVVDSFTVCNYAVRCVNGDHLATYDCRVCVPVPHGLPK